MASEKMIMEDQRRGSEECHNDEMTVEVREREISVMKVQLQVLEEWLQEQENQNRGWSFPLNGKKVKWQRLQQKRDRQINMQLTEELRKLEQIMDVQLRREELRAAELEEEVSIDETEEEIIDDFLNYWADPDQLDNVNPCVFIVDSCDVITGFVEEEVHEEDDQLEELVYEPTIKAVENCSFQTDKLCMNAGTVSDGDVMIQQCYKEIALLEYLLKNSEYDREVADEKVQYSERVQKDIMEADDVGERLVDNLESSSKDSFGKENQHSDVLIVEETSEQHTEVLAKEDKALMPSDFYSNKCFVNAGIIAEHLTQLRSQMKEEEVFCSRKQEGMDDWVAVKTEQVRTETSIEVRRQRVTVEIEKVKTEQAVLAQQTARNQQPGDLIDREIESIRRLMTKESRKKPALARKRRSRSSSKMKT